MKQMGCLWRSYKSRVVREIRDAPNNAERMKLRPKNIPSIEWRKFIKEKTSKEFQVSTAYLLTFICLNLLNRLLANIYMQAISDKYKERRNTQIPHTSSRKGMVRLAEDMVSVIISV